MKIRFLLRRALFKLRREIHNCGALKPTLSPYLASQLIAKAIHLQQPFLAGRLGYTEARCLDETSDYGAPSAYAMNTIWKESGVFPPAPDQFKRFADSYLRALGQVDLLGLLATQQEKRLVKKHSSVRMTCSLDSFDSYLHPFPWSKALKGRRVLVVHPFVESVVEQYQTRENLFLNPDVLPDFTLDTLKPPQTLLRHTDGLASWSEGLEKLCEKISRREFDVAILGCGAYGLPTGAFIKTELAKVAIYMGGATQILFGIQGKRWMERPQFRSLMTPAWRPPLESERPEGWEQFEGGCYW